MAGFFHLGDLFSKDDRKRRNSYEAWGGVLMRRRGASVGDGIRVSAKALTLIDREAWGPTKR
ncbi:hypothetical protein C7H84_15280 [Burkholderia sp. Nafp2/4-1b]|nr:hypothetical protein C7H84_15280 [Burkholderia sp. Nafp2/4-1b]